MARPRPAAGSTSRTAGAHGEGQVKLVSDVSLLDWTVVTTERVPGKSYRWYVNGKLLKQVLGAGSRPPER